MRAFQLKIRKSQKKEIKEHHVCTGERRTVGECKREKVTKNTIQQVANLRAARLSERKGFKRSIRDPSGEGLYKARDHFLRRKGSWTELREEDGGREQNREDMSALINAIPPISPLKFMLQLAFCFYSVFLLFLELSLPPHTAVFTSTLLRDEMIKQETTMPNYICSPKPLNKSLHLSQKESHIVHSVFLGSIQHFN